MTIRGKSSVTHWKGWSDTCRGLWNWHITVVNGVTPTVDKTFAPDTPQRLLWDQQLKYKNWKTGSKWNGTLWLLRFSYITLFTRAKLSTFHLNEPFLTKLTIGISTQWYTAGVEWTSLMYAGKRNSDIWTCSNSVLYAWMKWKLRAWPGFQQDKWESGSFHQSG